MDLFLAFSIWCLGWTGPGAMVDRFWLPQHAGRSRCLLGSFWILYEQEAKTYAALLSGQYDNFRSNAFA
ncbi:hypothetical protein KL938_002739 [Ogataea parapolymorpha]|nr:hypothetical protein KL938_002739 [Ogataea parapolymorpha]